MLQFTCEVSGEDKKFILDSGSPTLVLNSIYENDKGAVSAVNVNGGVANMQTKVLPSLVWGDMQLKNQFALIRDLSHLEQRLNATIHGLIGCSQFMNYDIYLNYHKCQLALIDSFGKIPSCMANAASIPLTMSNHIPVIQLKIGNKIYSFGLDTGAEKNILSKEHEEYCKDNGLVSKVMQEKIVRFNQNDSEQEVSFYSVNKVTIGQHITVDGMSFGFHDIKLPGIKVDGLLGYEFFSRQKTLICFAKRELLLQPFDN